MTDLEVRTLLADRLASVRGRIADACRRVGRDAGEVALIAVTKTVSSHIAAIALDLGMKELGESRPQELWKKAADVPGASWHLIGHLQRNKIERTIPLVSLVHSVDSVRVLEALAEFGRKRSEAVPVLLEVNCSREAAKGGFSPDELFAVCDNAVSLAGVSVRGLMTMAAYSDDPEQARPTFAELRTLRDALRTRTGLELPHLSMGMSHDFEVAVEEGATRIRIGTTLFEGMGENR